MKTLPANVVPYKETPVFDEHSTPAGLLASHHTKAGVWGRIVVRKGSLLYRILEPAIEEIELSPGVDGIVEPQVPHEVVPRPGVAFFVEFNRASDEAS